MNQEELQKVVYNEKLKYRLDHKQDQHYELYEIILREVQKQILSDPVTENDKKEDQLIRLKITTLFLFIMNMIREENELKITYSDIHYYNNLELLEELKINIKNNDIYNQIKKYVNTLIPENMLNDIYGTKPNKILNTRKYINLEKQEEEEKVDYKQHSYIRLSKIENFKKHHNFSEKFKRKVVDIDLKRVPIIQDLQIDAEEFIRLLKKQSNEEEEKKQNKKNEKDVTNTIDKNDCIIESIQKMSDLTKDELTDYWVPKKEQTQDTDKEKLKSPLYYIFRIGRVDVLKMLLNVVNHSKVFKELFSEKFEKIFFSPHAIPNWIMDNQEERNTQLEKLVEKILSYKNYVSKFKNLVKQNDDCKITNDKIIGYIKKMEFLTKDQLKPFWINSSNDENSSLYYLFYYYRTDVLEELYKVVDESEDLKELFYDHFEIFIELPRGQMEESITSVIMTMHESKQEDLKKIYQNLVYRILSYKHDQKKDFPKYFDIFNQEYKPSLLSQLRKRNQTDNKILFSESENSIDEKWYKKLNPKTSLYHLWKDNDFKLTDSLIYFLYKPDRIIAELIILQNPHVSIASLVKNFDTEKQKEAIIQLLNNSFIVNLLKQHEKNSVYFAEIAQNLINKVNILSFLIFEEFKLLKIKFIRTDKHEIKEQLDDILEKNKDILVQNHGIMDCLINVYVNRKNIDEDKISHIQKFIIAILKEKVKKNQGIDTIQVKGNLYDQYFKATTNEPKSIGKVGEYIKMLFMQDLEQLKKDSYFYAEKYVKPYYTLLELIANKNLFDLFNLIVMHFNKIKEKTNMTFTTNPLKNCENLASKIIENPHLEKLLSIEHKNFKLLHLFKYKKKFAIERLIQKQYKINLLEMEEDTHFTILHYLMQFDDDAFILNILNYGNFERKVGGSPSVTALQLAVLKAYLSKSPEKLTIIDKMISRIDEAITSDSLDLSYLYSPYKFDIKKDILKFVIVDVEEEKPELESVKKENETVKQVKKKIIQESNSFNYSLLYLSLYLLDSFKENPVYEKIMDKFYHLWKKPKVKGDKKEIHPLLAAYANNNGKMIKKLGDDKQQDIYDIDNRTILLYSCFHDRDDWHQLWESSKMSFLHDENLFSPDLLIAEHGYVDKAVIMFCQRISYSSGIVEIKNQEATHNEILTEEEKKTINNFDSLDRFRSYINNLIVNHPLKVFFDSRTTMDHPFQLNLYLDMIFQEYFETHGAIIDWIHKIYGKETNNEKFSKFILNKLRMKKHLKKHFKSTKKATYDIYPTIYKIFKDYPDFVYSEFEDQNIFIIMFLLDLVEHCLEAFSQSLQPSPFQIDFIYKLLNFCFKIVCNDVVNPEQTRKNIVDNPKKASFELEYAHTKFEELYLPEIVYFKRRMHDLIFKSNTRDGKDIKIHNWIRLAMSNPECLPICFQMLEWADGYKFHPNFVFQLNIYWINLKLLEKMIYNPYTQRLIFDAFNFDTNTDDQLRNALLVRAIEEQHYIFVRELSKIEFSPTKKKHKGLLLLLMKNV
mmetsp:Transcript_4207/g.6204  ORF Transcript_4207/g.6204 Transcript_4207/m.6204 type:complete len:1504 (+) Transcript_4207:59-4570(+)